MKILRIVFLLITFLAVGYASVKPLIFEGEEVNSLQEHTRQKRGLLLAKAGLLGGALLAKKALILGTGAGLIGGGLAGATVYKLKSHAPNGYYGGYGYPGGYSGNYVVPQRGYGYQSGSEANLYPSYPSYPPNNYGPPYYTKGSNGLC
ncbi:uncharacterized protein LOC103573036 [Microplitis demolitor]|uniref:uncharacterized protein LOC103573036 n=1 Tax=Microplitis demolitor TaxID=69319 RepID=UPI0004CDB1CA|nr:uncharacterized protein LOC103573036 [Microplitis demolitor]